jgi:hypothetical protein
MPANISNISNICICGHHWMNHADYDDTLERFITSGCEHWSGCECKQFEAKEETINAHSRLA